MFSPQPREQEFPPLLFALGPAEGPPATPRTAGTPVRTGAESSLSTQRRSVTTPGSVHTETTPPPPPPPVLRLTDDVTMEEPSTSRPTRYTPPPPMQSLVTPPAARPRASLMPYEQAPQFEDVWVTVFGFGQADVPLILREFGKCGDILQWGTFGHPQANFLHIQYQNKYAAQRALLRNGEQLSNTLIIGVKPLDNRHRQNIEGHGAADISSMMDVARPKALPERPYRVELSQGQQMPQPSRSLVSKVVEFVFGM